MLFSSVYCASVSLIRVCSSSQLLIVSVPEMLYRFRSDFDIFQSKTCSYSSLVWIGTKKGIAVGLSQREHEEQLTDNRYACNPHFANTMLIQPIKRFLQKLHFCMYSFKSIIENDIRYMYVKKGRWRHGEKGALCCQFLQEPLAWHSIHRILKHRIKFSQSLFVEGI
jgi:hypothetical protein